MNNSGITTLALGQQPTVGEPSDIDMDAITQEWKMSKAFVEQYSKDFPQLANLVDAVAIKKDEDNPFVGDVTLAGLVRSIPRDSLEQLPVFSAIINGTKTSIPAYIATFLLKKFVFNESTFGKGLLSTLQIGTEQALTNGYAAFMPTLGTMYDDYGTTLKLLHFADAAVEPGIQDGSEMGYSYVTANLTRTRVQKILANAKANPDTKWNVAALQQVLENNPIARNYSVYQSDPRRNTSGEEAGPTYEFVTRYETGVDGVIVTFCPQVSDTPLRVMETNSKFGYPRVMLLVVDPAPLTPFGISRVRLASPMQNLMNIYLGNIASMLLLNSKPPILKRGRFTKPVQAKQGAVWETLDQNAAADYKNMDNGSLQMFVEMANWITSQIQIIMGKGPASSTLDASTGSKTAPGANAQQQVEDASQNQITKIMENFLRQYALSALDTLLAEQEGEDDLIVDDDTKNAINNLIQQQNMAIQNTNAAASAVAPGAQQPLMKLIGDDNKFTLDWQRFYAAIEDMEIDIDVSVSKDQMQEKQRGDLQDMLVVLAQNATALGPEAVQKVQEITDMLMQDIAPGVKPIDIGSGAPAQPPAPTPGPGQAVVGNQVHETGDLVKLFGETTDPTLRNAILAAMGLPQIAKALPPVLVSPVDPTAMTNITPQGTVGAAPAAKPAVPQTA
jgi:hypothetical protein